MTRESVSEKGGDSMDYGKLKTYYESIDGVTVPFVYPQYWDKDKEEWVVVDKDNRLPVDARLTGSTVEEDVLWERDVRQGFTPSHRYLTPVNGARGFVLILKIYGLTGTFNSDEGYRLRYSKVTHSSYFTEFVSSEWSTRSGNRSGSLITVYPGLPNNDGDEGSFLTRDDLPYPALRVQPEVSGTFNSGEGVDCEVSILWIK